MSSWILGKLTPRDRMTELWPELSLRARLLILAVVFCMFAPLGALGEIASTEQVASTPWLLSQMAITGLFAVALFVPAAKGGRWLLLLPVAGAAYAACMALVPELLPQPHEVALADAVPPELDRELDVGTLSVMVALYASYAILLVFLTTEGLRQVRLQTEISLAREVHDALVPPVAGRFAGHEVHGSSRPSHEIGGDLFDVLQRDGELVVYVADISGHGVRANALAGMVKSAARMRLRTADGLDDVVAALNDVVFDLTPANVYATLGALRLRPGGDGELCLAGHLPLLQVPAGGGPTRRHPSSGLPAGMFAGTTYEATALETRSGDLLALYTDGLTEVEDADGQELGIHGLEALLARLRDRPLQEIHDAVLEHVGDQGPARDDRTLVLVRVP